MAQKTILVDDIDGSEEDVETVEFAWDGARYRIDLSPENRAKLADFMALYVSHGTRLTAAGRTVTRTQLPTDNAAAGTTGSGRSREQLAAIREWAVAEGYEVAPKGRVKADIIEAYDQAH